MPGYRARKALLPDGLEAFPVNIERRTWAGLLRGFADDDRITKRTFCGPLVERWAVSLPVMRWWSWSGAGRVRDDRRRLAW